MTGHFVVVNHYASGGRVTYELRSKLKAGVATYMRRMCLTMEHDIHGREAMRIVRKYIRGQSVQRKPVKDQWEGSGRHGPAPVE